MDTIANINDFRKLAKHRLPKIFFDYIDGGSFSETTLLRNRSDFQKWELTQRVLRIEEMPSLETEFFGATHGLPFMLGPVGFLGLYHRNGEVHTAKAAKKKAVPFCLSTFSLKSLDGLCREVGGRIHFQLYMDRNKSFVEHLLQVAFEADIDTLYLTVDTSVTSVREKDVRNGFRALTKLNTKLFLAMIQKPGWCLDMLRSGSLKVEAVSNYPEFGKGILEQASKLSSRLDHSLTWEDFKWLRKKWEKKLVLKGILSSNDALKAKDLGADAIVISNHGGRQLDYATSTIAALPEIRKAVGKEYCVMIDGGFRRGSEIVMALGLGADGVLLGRGYAFALAANGERGVEQAIEILSNEISITLKLMGLRSVKELQSLGRKCVKAY